MPAARRRSPATCWTAKAAGFPRTRALAYENPAFIEGLLEILVEATIEYLQAQIDAGANCVMLFESWSGIFPPEQFRKFVIEPTRAIVTALKSANPGHENHRFSPPVRPASGRICARNRRGRGRAGYASRILPPPSPPASGSTVFQGNLDPWLLKTGGPALDDGGVRLLGQVRGQPHIFNLGHGITPDVPPENVERLMNLIRNASDVP